MKYYLNIIFSEVIMINCITPKFCEFEKYSFLRFVRRGRSGRWNLFNTRPYSSRAGRRAWKMSCSRRSCLTVWMKFLADVVRLFFRQSDAFLEVLVGSLHVFVSMRLALVVLTATVWPPGFLLVISFIVVATQFIERLCDVHKQTGGAVLTRKLCFRSASESVCCWRRYHTCKMHRCEIISSSWAKLVNSSLLTSVYVVKSYSKQN